MILFNFTGLDRRYWFPDFERRADGPIWYASVRWLNVQVTAYSRAMGAEMVRRMNATLNAPTEPSPCPTP